MTIKTFPKTSLGFFPTPVVKLEKLSQRLGGPEIFMKRDDLTGLALGGNKTRKLEYILADAMAQGADTVVTAGAVQSNHCRQTAAAAAYLGMNCHLVLGGDQPEQTTGNLLLDTLFDSQIHWAGANRKGEDIPMIVDTLKRQDKKPYVVPYGGSNALGALSFIYALEELVSQTQNQNFSQIIFASSSGGTQAGLMVGNALLDKHYHIHGINIDKGSTGDKPFHQYILDLARETADKIGLQHAFDRSDVILNNDYVGDGYGIIGEIEREAIALTAQTEGVLLDPVYTGRAMGGLIDMVRAGKITKNEKILFWHTGGAPALFAYSDSLMDHKTKKVSA